MTSRQILDKRRRVVEAHKLLDPKGFPTGATTRITGARQELINLREHLTTEAGRALAREDEALREGSAA